MSKSKSGARDHRQELTDRLIARMSESVEYETPWVTCSDAPFNPVTGTRYKGVNFMATMSKGFGDPRWYTFLQIKALAAASTTPIFVKAGEEGTAIFHARKITIGGSKKDNTAESADDAIADSSSNSTIFVQDFCAYVFNASQIEGLPAYAPVSNEFEGQQSVMNLVAAFESCSGLSLEHRYGSSAFYSPSADTVIMPLLSQFKSESLYYRTLLHELGHATGHTSRLNRDQSGRMSNGNDTSHEKYAFEELVAEIASYYMGAELGLPYDARTHDNHASYLKSWLAALKNDKNFLFKAASQAGKAADFQKDLLKLHVAEHVIPLAA